MAQTSKEDINIIKIQKKTHEWLGSNIINAVEYLKKINKKIIF